MPKLPDAAEPTDWKENGIKITYAGETATHPFDADAKSKKEYNCAAKTNLATAWNLNNESLLNSPFR